MELDEGYAGDSKSQDGWEDTHMSTASGLPQGVMSLSEAERTEYVYQVLRTLRTSSIASIVDRVWPLLHIDPVLVLPIELINQVFSYLNPPDVLNASLASRVWRRATLDSQLWKQKFLLEGWALDLNEIRSYESGLGHASRGHPSAFSTSAEVGIHRSRGKKRGRESLREGNDALSHQASGAPISFDGTSPHNGQNKAEDIHCETEASTHDELDEEMEDRELGSLDVLLQHRNESPMEVEITENNEAFKEPRLMLPVGSKLNFHYLYKQKRKLEENWSGGRYRPFQLPHRDHAEEAHVECVYTIQYCGNYLVSGSRDRTLRIWNLETQRLVRKPLLGHQGSVLCLQFDNSEKEDVIISGSSDTDVIVWRFSTGKIIKKIARAHKESVLNLKFDERFLVTCSKDKTIKIWNRHDLRPGDKNYPVKGVEGGGRCPSYIIDLSQFSGMTRIEQHFTHEDLAPLQPYTTLMVLEPYDENGPGHTAAVNAIHIYKDQLVSASGDRSLKIWNIHTGVCKSIRKAHMKGIACVQYDGKRIVSGSSDNSIRIWDPISRAEVATLDGHSRLVRTIQSSFGDFPGTREGLAQEASAIDDQFFKSRPDAKASFYAPPKSKEREPGSRDPKAIKTVGASIPPGGGGSRWGRIVSGSYDETIIVWKHQADGKWVIAHRFKQADALRAAGPALVAQSDTRRNPLQAHPPQNYWLPAPTTTPQNQPALGAPPGPGNPFWTPTQITQQAMHTGAAALQTGLQNLQAINTHLASSSNHTNANVPQNSSDSPQLTNTTYHQTSASYQLPGNVQPHGPTIDPSGTSTPIQNSHATPSLPFVGTFHPQASNLPQPPNIAPPPPPVVNPPSTGVWPTNPNANYPVPLPTLPNTNPNPNVPPAIGPHGPVGLPLPAHIVHQITHPNARIFKLQFDARRIVCCSQDPKIVGWDFANGDPDIEMSSRFFAAPQ